MQLLSLRVFTLVLALALWLALGSMILGVVEGGSHPLRRLLIGLLLVTATALALARRRTVCRWLGARPWLVVPLAVMQVGAAAIDGLPASSPYLAFSMTSIALAVVVARARTVWLTVAVLELSYVLAIVATQAPSQVVASGHLDGVIGAMLGFPFVALIGLGVIVLFKRFLSGVQPTLDELRRGGPGLTPALSQAILSGPRARRQLPSPPPAATLTPAERRVVEGLAGGRTPKQLAHSWDVSITTVRTHIRHAKRKTRARTLTELAGMAGRSDWPRGPDRDG